MWRGALFPQLRLGASCGKISRFWRLRLQKSAYGGGESLDLAARVTAAATAMQAFHDRRRRQIFFRQREAILCVWGRGLRRTAPHPQQPLEVHAHRCGRSWIECVRHIDPRAHSPGLREARDKLERNRGSPRALGPDEFGERSDGEPATQDLIQRVNTCGSNRPDDPWSGRECRWNPGGEGGLDLKADCGGGGHGERFRLIFAFLETVCKPCLHKFVCKCLLNN